MVKAQRVVQIKKQKRMNKILIKIWTRCGQICSIDKSCAENQKHQ